MQRLVFIISIILLPGAFQVMAQEDSLVVADPVPEQVEDTTSLEPRFALVLSADYGKGIESLATKQQKWEFGISGVLSNKIALVAEYGYGQLYPESVIQNGSYKVEGNYYRAGAEFIFTVLPKHYLALGAMYASSTFSDYGLVEIYSEFWPDVIEEFSRENFTASWGEIILDTQGPIANTEKAFFRNLSWGIRFRLRIMITDLQQPQFDIYAVPGYGKTYSEVLLAANLFLRYRINF
jgi:hypothetical protein